MCRHRLSMLACLAVLGAAPARGQVEDDDALFAAMVGLVVSHDIAIIAGVAPTPLIQYTAETVEFSANLGLKALRPWLKAPPNIAVDPALAPTNTKYTADGCGIDFELLAPQAGYENLFGVANFRDPFVDARDNRLYRWQNSSNPLDTRWGFLQAPRLYHANSSVQLSVGTPFTTRRFNIATNTFSDPYKPIDSFAQDPQHVYLPIGQNTIEWRAGTQLNWISDVAIPGALLAIGVLTEVKNVYGGAKVAKQVKGVGISDAVIDEALDPQGAARLSEGVKRFDKVWQKAWKDRQAAKRSKLLREIRRKIGCEFLGAMLDVLEKAAGSGVTVLDEKTGNFLLQQGVVTRAGADMLTAIHSTYSKLHLSLGITAIKAGLSCDDPDEIIAAVIETLLNTTGIDAYFTKETKVSYVDQVITVWDSQPPVINIDPQPLIVEATDFGGTRLYRARPQMLAMAEAGTSDNCGRMPDLELQAPELLPLGQTEVTWIAHDKGPNPPGDGQNYSPTATQTIIVRDTQPPILLAPPSKVIEAAANVPLAVADIGAAAAVDLADVQPRVVNDAPAEFPLDRRTQINWTATDKSGNAAAATQQITVKTPGANTAPVANDAAARTLTAEPVDVRLTASDADVLDGTADPLWFKIESQPAKGAFIAPLFPFFIEDYRTKPGDGLGPDYDPTTDDLFTFISTHYCQTSFPVRVPPRNFVHQAQFVHVTDAGVRYVLDEFFECNPFDDGVQTFARFSKWNASGEFLGQAQIGSVGEDRPLDDTFVIDRDGLLYYYTASEVGSSSNELFLWRCTTDWQNPDTNTSQICRIGYKFDSSSTPDIDARSLSVARIDSATNVAYVADAFGIFAFELGDSGGTRYLGELGPKAGSQVLDGWVGKPQALEVGSDGSLYVADSLKHRIHKIGPVKNDPTQGLAPGDYVGWAGRCTGSGNKACDDLLERSRGYSCTFEADSCTVDPGALSGAAQGQFNTPRFIAIDPHDVLYVADFENERIQRFSPDGSFAGEAVSDGSGINKGDRPSFVIGNMGKPASVSVNSSQFYVVDRDEQFVHVFGTLPFKDITDDAVTVTYVSNQDFPNPNITGTDSFTFSVSDGLVSSAPATVTLTVDRNFRPPVALDRLVATDEDVSVDIELPADDPDGIAGKDFLGLDTLTYTITSMPQHGGLTGSGAAWTYTPEGQFYGEDRFTFKVNDGRDDSNEATVTIAVTAVNDPPAVTIVAPDKVALGFPVLLSTNFLDDPSDSYEARVDWGDGRSDVTGGIVDGSSDPALDGVAITNAPMPGVEGQTFAQHVYEVAGPHVAVVCVKDSGGLEGCDTLQINAEPLVSLGFSGIVYDQPLAADEITLQEVADGVPFTYELTVQNGQPSVGTGKTATDVVLDAQLPARLNVKDVAISQGSCTVNAPSIRCAVGDLEPAGSATLKVVAFGPGTIAITEARDFEGVLTTSSAALESEVEFSVNVDVVPNLADGDGDGMSDGFELAFGLDLTRDDGAEDPDGDGIDNLKEFELGTSPHDPDTDHDGLSDFAEYISGITDPTNSDTDDDGMPDGWEVDNGLNPALADDAGADADGDGLSNAEEFAQGKNPNRDDVPPVVIAAADLTIVATGRRTLVPLGAATATDVHDGPVPVSADSGKAFTPGAHLVTWSAADALGNVGIATQHVNVIPLVSFAVDQTVAEGATAIVRVELNGPAASYPVTVPYVIGGSASYPSDYTALGGEVSIASGIAGQIEIDISADAVVDPDETIVLSMGSPANAAPGQKTTHTITIGEGNSSPRVRVRTEQQGRAATTAARDGGLLSVSADVTDDPGNQHVFDWSASDGGIFNPQQATAQAYELDPFDLNAGLYALRVRVTDDGVPPAASETRSVLRLVDRLPILNALDDSDHDGIDDLTEGNGDSDGDRVADYLDDIPNSNLMLLADDDRALEVNTGLGLRLGEAAFAIGSPYVTIPEDALAPDLHYGYANGVADFEVTGVETGGSAEVVIPLRHPITAGSVYRKVLDGLWQDFVVDGVDAIASAGGSDGACPPPGSAAYQAGLHIGDGCLQLTMTDGGPNDSDRAADGVIRDPGGLAVPVAVTLEVLPQPSKVLSGTGDAVVLRLRLHTSSGDVLLRSLTLAASNDGDDRSIRQVSVVHDTDADGMPQGDPVIASGTFQNDNGVLTLTLSNDLEVPFGTTDVLVVYSMGNGAN